MTSEVDSKSLFLISALEISNPYVSSQRREGCQMRVCLVLRGLSFIFPNLYLKYWAQGALTAIVGMLLYEETWLNGQPGEGRWIATFRWPEERFCYYFTSSPISPILGDTAYRKARNSPLNKGANSASGWKRYLLKTMEAAPLPPPWLQNSWPRNGLPPSSEKEALPDMAPCSDPCCLLGIAALGWHRWWPEG